MNPSRTFGGLAPGAVAALTGARIGGRVLSPRRVRQIQAQNASRPAPSGPQGSPLTAALASRLRPLGADDPSRTGTDPAVIQKLREQFGGPGAAGFNFMAGVLGKDLAGYVAPHLGAPKPLGFHPSPAGAVLNAVSDLPPERGPMKAFQPTLRRLKELDIIDDKPWSLGAPRVAGEIVGRAPLHGYGQDGAVTYRTLTDPGWLMAREATWIERRMGRQPKPWLRHLAGER